MYATRHMDWLSVTVDSRADVNGILPSADFVYTGAGHHGYRSAFEDRISGARVETDSPIEGMDTHVTMSGQTLHIIRSWFSEGDDGIAAAVRASAARASRVDLAVNIHDCQVTVHDFYMAYKERSLKTPMRRAYYVEGIGDDRAGDTLYIGSPKSDRQVRIYNKSAEQAISDPVAWLRLEVVLRDLRAKSALAATQDHHVSAVAAAHMAQCVLWGNVEYASSLADDPAPIVPIKRKRPATEKWLLEQCAPSLARVYAVNPDFMVEFMTLFRQSFDKLQSKD